MRVRPPTRICYWGVTLAIGKNRLIYCVFVSVFFAYRDVTIGLQNLGLCSALPVFEQRKVCTESYLQWHGIYTISSEGQPCSVASDDKPETPRTYSNPYPHENAKTHLHVHDFYHSRCFHPSPAQFVNKHREIYTSPPFHFSRTRKRIGCCHELTLRQQTQAATKRRHLRMLAGISSCSRRP